MHVLGNEGLRVITAQARELTSEDQGYSFVHCSITGDGKGTFLGRAWKARPLVVFAYTNMGSVVDPAGWSDNFHPDRDRYVGYIYFVQIGFKYNVCIFGPEINLQ